MIKIKGNIVDVIEKKTFYGELTIENGVISNIVPCEGSSDQYILPGFVDAHIHIESSMLVPSEFARLAVGHGTVATVSDPHEIANVLGMPGVYYMMENGRKVPFKFYFGAPSCVPATTFETAGAVLDSNDIAELMKHDDIKYLAEMMNYPGVIYKDAEVLAKIEAAQAVGKPIDGHAPGLSGEDIKNYIGAGISTDHECFTYENALEKLNLGMKILIREGSAAKNFEALIDLIKTHPDDIMLCSDDKHPDDLMLGHINLLVKRAIDKGYDFYDVLRAASVNPIQHYNLEVGLLQKGDNADFVIYNDLESFIPKATYINGVKVSEGMTPLFDAVDIEIVNNFNTSYKSVEDFEVLAQSSKIKVIKTLDGELVTQSFETDALIEDGKVISDTKKDVLKIVVINRYGDSPISKGFINNFGLQKGAIASCVAHDSHNIIAVGVDDESICEAVNLIIENRGGVSAVGDKKMILPLPIAGIMSDKDGKEVGNLYAKIDQYTKSELGSTLKAPFMTLSFMGLLVIPQLKMSDLGLFDGDTFSFSELFV